MTSTKSTKGHRNIKAIGPNTARECRQGRGPTTEPQFCHVGDGEDLPQEAESSLWGCRKTKRKWSPRGQDKNVEEATLNINMLPSLLIEGRWGLRIVLWIWQYGVIRDLGKRSFMGWWGWMLTGGTSRKNGRAENRASKHRKTFQWVLQWKQLKSDVSHGIFVLLFSGDENDAVEF